MADRHRFTAAERRELFLQCAMGVLEALAGGLGEAATLQVLIDVVQSDMARLALVTAQRPRRRGAAPAGASSPARPGTSRR